MFLSLKCYNPYLMYGKSQIGHRNMKPANRGAGRTDIIEKYGYDTKFAYHTIRLLETARDLIQKGELKVRRPNGDFLRQIRNGEAFKDYNEFHAYAEALIDDLEQFDLDKSPLPKEPDLEKINLLSVCLHLGMWQELGYSMSNQML